MSSQQSTVCAQLLEMGYDEATATRCSNLHPNDVSAAVAATQQNQQQLQFNFSVDPSSGSGGGGQGLQSLTLGSGGPLDPGGLGGGGGGLDDILSNANAAAGSNVGGPGGEGLGGELDIEDEACEADLIFAIRNYCPPQVFESIRQQYQQNPDPAAASNAVIDVLSSGSSNAGGNRSSGSSSSGPGVEAMKFDKEQVNLLIMNAQSCFLQLLNEGLPEQPDDSLMSPSCRTPVESALDGEEDAVPLPVAGGTGGGGGGGSGSGSGSSGSHHTSHSHITLGVEDEAVVQDIINTLGQLNRDLVASVYIQSGRNKAVAIQVLASQ